MRLVSRSTQKPTRADVKLLAEVFVGQIVSEPYFEMGQSTGSFKDCLAILNSFAKPFLDRNVLDGMKKHIANRVDSSFASQKSASLTRVPNGVWFTQVIITESKNVFHYRYKNVSNYNETLILNLNAGDNLETEFRFHRMASILWSVLRGYYEFHVYKDSEMTKESERVLKIKSEVLMFDMEYMPDSSGFFYVMHYISEQHNVTLSQLMFTYVTAASMSTVYRAPEECQIEKLP